MDGGPPLNAGAGNWRRTRNLLLPTYSYYVHSKKENGMDEENICEWRNYYYYFAETGQLQSSRAEAAPYYYSHDHIVHSWRSP